MNKSLEWFDGAAKFV